MPESYTECSIDSLTSELNETVGSRKFHLSLSIKRKTDRRMSTEM